jgi:hypothetical protein
MASKRALVFLQGAAPLAALESLHPQRKKWQSMQESWEGREWSGGAL